MGRERGKKRKMRRLGRITLRKGKGSRIVGNSQQEKLKMAQMAASMEGSSCSEQVPKGRSGKGGGKSRLQKR